MVGKIDKNKTFEDEFNKWHELFSTTPEETQKAVSGLIAKISSIHVYCCELEYILNQSGAIKVHPTNNSMQKAVPALKEYSRMTDCYANLTNKLQAIKTKNTVEEDDDLAAYD
jgi:hypothetical protein